MTRDDIIRMAREAEFYDLVQIEYEIDYFERFAHLISSHVAEECAKTCESMARRTEDIRRAALEVAAENIRSLYKPTA